MLEAADSQTVVGIMNTWAAGENAGAEAETDPAGLGRGPGVCISNKQPTFHK